MNLPKMNSATAMQILHGSLSLWIYTKYFGCLTLRSITTFTISRRWFLKANQYAVLNRTTTKVVKQKKWSFKLLYQQNLVGLIKVGAIKVHHQVSSHSDHSNCNPRDHHLNRLITFHVFHVFIICYLDVKYKTESCIKPRMNIIMNWKEKYQINDAFTVMNDNSLLIVV